MNSIKALVSVAFALSSIGVSGAGIANAGESNCSCIALSSANSGPVGSIETVRGEVFVSGPEGYSVAEKGSDLYIGSSLTVGDQSRSVFRIGANCVSQVPANSEVLISRVGENDSRICAKITSSSVKSGDVASTTTTNANGESISLGGGSVAGANGDGGASALLFAAGSLAGLGTTVAESNDDDDPGATPATP